MGPDNRQNMEVFLGKLSKPEEAMFSERFGTLVNSGSQDIGIFVTNGVLFFRTDNRSSAWASCRCNRNVLKEESGS